MKIVNEMSDEDVLREFGTRIAQLRISSRLTQDELARRAGVSKRSIERIEKGEGGIRLQIVIAIARALRCLGGLNIFVPEAQVSPYDIVENQKALPKRVRSRKQVKHLFKWGE